MGLGSRSLPVLVLTKMGELVSPAGPFARRLSVMACQRMETSARNIDLEFEIELWEVIGTNSASLSWGSRVDFEITSVEHTTSLTMSH